MITIQTLKALFLLFFLAWMMLFVMTMRGNAGGEVELVTPTSPADNMPTPVFTMEIEPRNHITPTPSPTLRPDEYAQVSGKFIFANEPPPVGEFRVALCEVEIFDNHRWCVFTQSEEYTSPMTDYDEFGYWHFDEIIPGEYGLVMYFDPEFQAMPNWPDTESPVTFFAIENQNRYIELSYNEQWCEVENGLCFIEFDDAKNLFFPVVRNDS